MSRRGALTAPQVQFRAMSRMTPGTRMWSEQPLVDRRERWVLGKVTPREGPPQLFPPASLQYIKYQQDAPVSYSVSLLARQQAVFVCAAPADQPMTIGFGWQVLDDSTVGSQRTIVVTRTARVNESTLVVSTPGKTFLWNGLSMAGFIVTPHAIEQQQYNFSVYEKWETVSRNVTIHPWSGPSNAYRMRCLTGRGLYAGWVGPSGEEAGHNQSQMGWITPGSTFYFPYSLPAPEAYLTTPWVSGSYEFDSIGVTGTPHWTEHHIRMVPR